MLTHMQTHIPIDLAKVQTAWRPVFGKSLVPTKAVRLTVNTITNTLNVKYRRISCIVVL